MVGSLFLLAVLLLALIWWFRQSSSRGSSCGCGGKPAPQDVLNEPAPEYPEFLDWDLPHLV
jgi:hypothetical protein